MHPSAVLSVTGLAAICLISGSAAAWLWIASHWRRGAGPLDYEPRPVAPWTDSDDLRPAIVTAATRLPLWDRMRLAWTRLASWRPPHAMVLLLAYLLLQVGFGRLALDWSGGDNPFHAAAEPHASAEPQRERDQSDDSDTENPYDAQAVQALLIASASVNVVFALLVVIVLRFGRAGASWEDLGLPLTRLGYDLRVGLIGFVAASVPVYLLQGLLGLFVKGEHPIVKFVKETNDIAGLVVAAVTAVLVAPLVEELLFRVLLQGWLEATWPRMSPPNSRLPAVAARDALPIPLPQDPLHTPIAWMPIVVSSAIFALLHVGHGPDPIPLFILALVLGYLYQRTHRIWASVTLHFSLNLCSLLLLWAQESTRAALS